VKRGGRLQRTKPLRQRRRKKKVVPGAELWHLDLGPCAMYGFDLGCYGRIEGHHLISQQQLRKRGLHDQLWRLENRLPLCQHHHELHTKALHRVPRTLLPVEAWAFARELDFGSTCSSGPILSDDGRAN
jgi:hypothetical protein